VGQHGTLLERRNSSWSRSGQAASLVGGQDFTAADALPDGTLLALAGGSVIVRDPGRSGWAPAPVAPLGSTPLRLGGYRDSAGRLHMLALVAAGGADVVLDGDSTGWRPVTVPSGMEVSDLEVDQSGQRVWLAGQAAGRPITTELPLTGDLIPAGLASPGSAASLSAATSSPAATISARATGSSPIDAATSVVTRGSAGVLGALGL